MPRSRLFLLLVSACPVVLTGLSRSYTIVDPTQIQDSVEGIAVFASGSVVCASTTDRGGRPYGIYRDGRAIGACSDMDGPGTRGGCAAAVSDRYLFIAVVQSNETGDLKGDAYPPKGLAWFCVSRRTLSGDHAPFVGGRGRFGDCLVVNVAPASMNAQVRGLACDGKGRLFVSDPASASIRVLDHETMRETARITSLRSRQISVAPDGSLWALHAPDPSAPVTDLLKPERDETQWRIVRYADDGRELTTVWLPRQSVPVGPALDGRGRLLVADGRPGQPIRVYADPNNTGQRPRSIRLPDRVGELMGLGFDGTGNLYVAGKRPGGGTVIRCYEPPEPGRRLKLRWKMTGPSDGSDGSDGSDKSDGV